MNREKLQDIQLQLYRHTASPDKSLEFPLISLSQRPSGDTRVSIYAREDCTRVNTHLVPRVFSLSERLLIEFFMGLLNGATRFTLRWSFGQLKKRFPSYERAISVLVSATKNSIRCFILTDLLISTFLSKDEQRLFLIDKEMDIASFLIPSSVALFGYQLLVMDLIIDELMDWISRFSPQRKITQVLFNLVIFLTTMASVMYTDDEENNPIQGIIEYLLHILVSMAMELAMEFLLECWENPVKIMLRAIRHDRKIVIRLLLTFGANVNVKDSDGKTFLHYVNFTSPRNICSTNSKIAISNMLLSAGADVNAVNTHGETPFHLAIINSSPAVISNFLAAGADVNAVNNYGEAPLYLAVRFIAGSYSGNQIISQILAAGADPNIATLDEIGIRLLLLQGVNADDLARNIPPAGITPLCWIALSLGVRRRPNDENRLNVSAQLIRATFLRNPTIEKPDFIQITECVSSIWDDCKAEMAAEMQRLGNKRSGPLSLKNICIEKNMNKLARMSQNEEMRLKSEKTNFLERYPYYGGQIRLNFKKGLHRDKTLTTALNLIYTRNKNKGIDKDCWSKILELVEEGDLRNVVLASCLFFKSAPVNSRSQVVTTSHRQVR